MPHKKILPTILMLLGMLLLVLAACAAPTEEPAAPVVDEPVETEAPADEPEQPAVELFGDPIMDEQAGHLSDMVDMDHDETGGVAETKQFARFRGGAGGVDHKCCVFERARGYLGAKLGHNGEGMVAAHEIGYASAAHEMGHNFDMDHD